MIKNAKIVGIEVDPNSYHKQKGERGTPDFAMSSSAMRLFWAFPSKWKAGFDLAPSASLEYGSLFDLLVLTPNQFDARYAITPDTYAVKVMECPKCGSQTNSLKCKACGMDREEITIDKPWNANSDVCGAWIDAQNKAGKEIVSAKDLQNAKDAAKRLLADEPIKKFLDACQKQVHVTAEWHDEDTGLVIPLKCLIDLVSKNDSAFPKSIGDLKTTRNAAPVPWAKWAEFAGYSTQAGFNTDMFVAATGREIINFCFVLSENMAPWEPGRRFMSQDILEPGMDTGCIASGRRQYIEILKGYCKCVKSGKWPGYDDTDEASDDGWTLVKPSPWAEQDRLYAPKFQFSEEPPVETEGEENPDLIP